MIPFDSKTCFLFDLDGTLVDSSPLHERVFRQVLRDRAPRFLAGFDYEPLKGKSTLQSFRDLGVPPGPLLDCLVAEKQRRYRDAVLSGTLSLTPGARPLLEFLAGRGRRLFLVTGGSRPSVASALAATGLERFFEGAVTSTEVPRAKPAPDCFRYCLDRFALGPSSSLVIEDSANGLAAARSAGLDAVLVNNPDLRPAEAWVFPDLAAFHRALVGQQEFAHAQ